eukprot:Sspe_Gene.57926::Locus_31777_Transcript_4_4_Confidence_0.375_Length_1414::g.57926::m.57926/K08857/NEK1_4_5; NIMA (never in mitosis gene a)-related kinase 1/4/5
MLGEGNSTSSPSKIAVLRGEDIGPVEVVQTLQLRSDCRVDVVKTAAGERLVRKVVALSGQSERDRAKQLREAQALAETTQHPNIVRLVQASMGQSASFPNLPPELELPTDDAGEPLRAPELTIFMEYCEGGDMAELLRERVPVSEGQVTRWLGQLLEALAWMHAKGIMHRDIKAANVFFTPGRETVKLGDFGSCSLLETNENATTLVGTPYYLAPEMCNGKPYCPKVDVWSLGVLAYELCTGTRPWRSTSLPQLIFEITTGGPVPRIPQTYSDGLADLVEALLKRDPAERPTAQAALQMLSQTSLSESYCVSATSTQYSSMSSFPSEAQDDDSSVDEELPLGRTRKVEESRESPVDHFIQHLHEKLARTFDSPPRTRLGDGYEDDYIWSPTTGELPVSQPPRRPFPPVRPTGIPRKPPVPATRSRWWRCC